VRGASGTTLILNDIVGNIRDRQGLGRRRDGAGFAPRDLHDYVEDVRTQLLSLPTVSKINLLGIQDERIYIEFDTAQLAGLRIDRDQAIESLRSQNAVASSGVVTTSGDRIALRRERQPVRCCDFEREDVVFPRDAAFIGRRPDDDRVGVNQRLYARGA
jgi:Cu/Ag efflux pump CusA